MRLLSSGPDDPMNGLVHDERPVFPTIARQPYIMPNGAARSSEPPQAFDVLALARRYWLLLFVFLILGTAVGFVSISPASSPMYKTLLLMEVQSASNALAQTPGMAPASAPRLARWTFRPK